LDAAPELRFTFTPTIEEYLALTRPGFRRNRRTLAGLFVTAGLVGVVADLLFLHFGAPGDQLLGHLWALMIATVLFFGWRSGVDRKLRRRFAEGGRSDPSVTLRLDATGILVADALRTLSFTWPAVLAANEDAKFFTFTIAGGFLVWLPKRVAVSDADREALRRLLSDVHTECRR